MPPSQTNVVLLRRVERVIGALAPLLDLLLAAGDRASRLLERDDRDYVPPRMAREGESAPRGLRRPIAAVATQDRTPRGSV
ncbi:MAG: hypothetical protein E6G05_07925 [Actinobacteria bacterium]|nr:MAG: hypothetical protein E6G05_07925 [Actinomycetota bacterium]